ncbi:MAG: YHS domain-containing protein [Chloroflexi bacterium]|nr:YHS domain-containing protein [Chloroflexota bacterium]
MVPWERTGQAARRKETIVAKDPVCGMDVDPATAKGQSDYKGQTYYFCAPGCKRAFDQDPERYLNQPRSFEGMQRL